MAYIVTISSKRQFTIPADLCRRVGLARGDKVVIEERDGELRIKSALDLVNRLAGSVSVSPKSDKVDLDQTIAQAKKTYFDSTK